MWAAWDGGGAWAAPSAQLVVALTGTGSLLSGLLLLLEWWWSRQHGASLLARLSLARATPWLGAPPAEPAAARQSGCTCAILPNPLSLLRGAECRRLRAASGREPLSYFDMNLTAQEHQVLFGGGPAGAAGAATAAGAAGGVRAAEAAALARMACAWRARDAAARVAGARAALAELPTCAPALLLLAEEEAEDVDEAERLARRAWRCAEAAERAAAAAGDYDAHRRSAAVSAAARRRVAACWRRRGRLRDAVRLLRAQPPYPAHPGHPAHPAHPSHPAHPASHALTRDLILELLLEQRAYADAEVFVSRCEEAGIRTATVLWTAALVRLRPGAAGAGAGPAGAAAGAEAAKEAARANPHVARLLLELEPLRPPPEHVVPGGRSEALCYAAAFLPHWRRSGALEPLAAVLPRAALRPAASLCRARTCVDDALLAPAPPAPAPRPALLAAAALAAAVGALAWAAAPSE